MKTFKYRHAPVVYVLSALIMIFTAVGCFFGVRSAIFADLLFQRVAFILLSVTSLFIFLLAFGIMLFSRYSIKKGKIFIRLGILVNYIRIDEVTILLHFIDIKKLAICLPNDRYVFAVIAPDEIDSFVKAVKEENPHVIYDVCYSSLNEQKKS